MFDPVLPIALERGYGIDLPFDLGERLATSIFFTFFSISHLLFTFSFFLFFLSSHSLLLYLTPIVTVPFFVFDKLPSLRTCVIRPNCLPSTMSLPLRPAIGRRCRLCSTRRLAIVRLTRTNCASGRIPGPLCLFLSAPRDQRGARWSACGHPGPARHRQEPDYRQCDRRCGRGSERVLFVTEKRAAIEAVTERLAEARLADLVLDLHGKQVTRREVARQVSESLDRLSTALPPDVEDVHRALAASLKALVRHATEKCEVRAPWGLSAHDVEQKLLCLPATARSEHLLLPRRAAATRSRRCRQPPAPACGLRRSRWLGAPPR